MSSIQQILRLGYLQESNRTQGTILSRQQGDVSCWAAGLLGRLTARCATHSQPKLALYL